jgi:hypothetical protein
MKTQILAYSDLSTKQTHSIGVYTQFVPYIASRYITSHSFRQVETTIHMKNVVEEKETPYGYIHIYPGKKKFSLSRVF